LGVDAAGKPLAHRQKRKLLKKTHWKHSGWRQMEEKDNIIVKWAQEDVETSNNLLNNNNNNNNNNNKGKGKVIPLQARCDPKGG